MVRILKISKNFQNSGKHKITPIPIRVKLDKIEKIVKQQDYKEVEARAARARAENLV